MTSRHFKVRAGVVLSDADFTHNAAAGGTFRVAEELYNPGGGRISTDNESLAEALLTLPRDETGVIVLEETTDPGPAPEGGGIGQPVPNDTFGVREDRQHRRRRY